MRLLAIFLILAVVFAIPLVLFGDRFDRALAGDAGADLLDAYGSWAWVVAMGLLVADLVLPIPSTAVMTALGILYGPILGGLISAAGAFSAGAVAYAAPRLAGERAAVFLVERRDLARARAFFEGAGAWAVAFSRVVPLLAEVVACLAGLSGMRPGRFFMALACGCLPMGFAFATLGAMGSDRPIVALVVGAAAPGLLWPIARKLLRHR